jgi:hypothetical protein
VIGDLAREREEDDREIKREMVWWVQERGESESSGERGEMVRRLNSLRMFWPKGVDGYNHKSFSRECRFANFQGFLVCGFSEIRSLRVRTLGIQRCRTFPHSGFIALREDPS